MRPPLWKKYLSYLTELHIESAPSPHNPHLYVSLYNGRYQLCTAHAIYSYEDRYDNFAIALQKIDLQKIQGKQALILGFGLGSIPIILEKKHQRILDYTAVEIDESVLYLANKYALPSLKAPIQFVCADALAFVQQCTQTFDFIAVDIFLDDKIPISFQQVPFLEKLRNLLAPSGILMYNRLATTPTQQQENQRFMQSIFKPVFPKGIALDVHQNQMLLNRKDILL